MPHAPRDLIERTFEFARRVRRLVGRVPQTIANVEDIRQLIRSSGSVASNYIESQEALSRKDFFYRIKVCRKEARESGLWLRLINPGSNSEVIAESDALFLEAEALTRIFSSIIKKDESSTRR